MSMLHKCAVLQEARRGHQLESQTVVSWELSPPPLQEQMLLTSELSPDTSLSVLVFARAPQYELPHRCVPVADWGKVGSLIVSEDHGWNLIMLRSKLTLLALSFLILRQGTILSNTEDLPP